MTMTMSQSQPATQFALSTEYGDNGPYSIGVEYHLDDDVVYHAVRRPVVLTEFLGYGISGHYGQAITRVTHSGPYSEWRCDGRVIERPSHPPYLHLPEGDDGAPIDVPTTTADVYMFEGQAITSDDATAKIEAYKAREIERATVTDPSDVAPEMAPGWEDRAVERARDAGLFDR